jgi:hypothetical protein
MDQATDVLVGPYNVHLRVSIFDAHHCAGAVQLLFDGPVGRILHTGECVAAKRERTWWAHTGVGNALAFIQPT